LGGVERNCQSSLAYTCRNLRTISYSSLLLVYSHPDPCSIYLCIFNCYCIAVMNSSFIQQTETALLEVLDGVYTAADDKQISVLISLDLSAAFDTIDHLLLIKRLQLEFGVSDTVLEWLLSYLVDRIQFVKMGQHQTRLSTGSVLGPLLFAVYCSPVGDIICRHTRSVPYPHHHTSTITPDLANLHVNSIHPPCHYFTDLLREHMSPTALTDVVCLLKL